MTTPVVRCLKKQINAEVHYLTKPIFIDLISANPFIDQLYSLSDDWNTMIENLKAEKYDLIVDLHNNLRSRRIRASMSCKSVVINKLNFRKQLLIYTGINRLPDLHVAERGLQTISHLGVKDDREGMDFFFSSKLKFTHPFEGQQYVCLALGTTHFTKNIPLDLLQWIVNECRYPMIFLGGPKEKELGNTLAFSDPSRLKNKAGDCSLQESALYIDRANYLIAGDTGMLHIAAALKKPTISVWGATIPEYGVFPYYGKYKVPHHIHEVKLSCRPCSKHGSAKCPKGHFNCMNKQDRNSIRTNLQILDSQV